MLSPFRWSASGSAARLPPFRLRPLAGAALAALLIGGCHQDELIRKARQDPNSLLIVDCKLPPQVRSVGLAMQYIAPGQGIKTSAIDCGIRGGEYVAYDRANYATALNVWLASAEAGDAEAQANVGEIYEKGLGTTPNYAEAARWYQKSAAAGNSRAELALGYLYEQGLGVPKDPVASLNWYRKAAGLSEELALASRFGGADTEQIRRQLTQAREEVGALRGELAESRQEIETLRQRLGGSQSELENSRNKLRNTLEELERARSRQQQAPPEQKQNLQQYEQEIKSKEAAARREAEAVARIESRYRRDNEALQAKLKAAERRAASLNSELDKNRFGTERLQAQLAQTEATLEKLKLDYQTRQAVAAPPAGSGGDGKLKDLEGRLDQRERELQAQRTKAAALEEEVARLGREKQAFEQQAKGQSSARDDNLKAVAAQLAAMEEKQRLESERTAELKRQNAELAAERDRVLAEKKAALAAQARPDSAATAAEQQKRLDALQAQLGQREQELQAQRLKSGELEAEVARLGREKQAFEQQAKGQSSARDDNLKAVAAQLAAAEEKQRLESARTAELERQNAQLAAERERLLAENKAAVEEARARPDSAALAAEQQKRLDALQAQLGQRERELQAQQLKSGELQADIARLGREKQALEQKVGGQSATRDQSLESISKQLVATMDKQREEQRKAQELEQQNARLRAEKEQLLASQGATDAQSKAQLDKLSKQIAEYEKERTKLQAALETAQSQGASQPGIVTADAPRILLQDPGLTLTRGAGTPTVKLSEAVAVRKITGRVLAPDGIQSLTVNDRSETVSDSGVFTTEIKLTGKETAVNILLIDKKGRQDKLDFRLVVPGAASAAAAGGALPPDIEFGKYYALVIGNNQYTHLPPLSTPINDAASVADVLRQKYGFTVTQLTNATRYDILSALNKMRDNLKEKDNLLIYYAGHGELDKVNQQGQWLPIDAEQNNTANWIPTDAVTALLNQIAAKHILVVADSCYSGAMTRTALANLKTGVSDELKVKWVKKMLENKSRTVLTSGGLAPVLEAGAGNHSIFAETFIKALQGNNDIVQGQDLFRMVSDQVKRAAERFRFEQVPQYAPIRYTDHEASDFFFVPVRAG